MADRRAGPKQGPYVSSPHGGKEVHVDDVARGRARFGPYRDPAVRQDDGLAAAACTLTRSRGVQ